MTISPVDSEEKILFIGSLKSVTLEPKEFSKPLDAKNMVSLSRCARQVADFQVLEVIRGSGFPSSISIENNTDEWCQLGYEVTKAPVLVLVHFNPLFGIQVDTTKVYRDSTGREIVFVDDWILPDVGRASNYLKPTDISVTYKHTQEIAPSSLKELLSRSYLKKEEDRLVFTQGLYIDDLRNIYKN